MHIAPQHNSIATHIAPELCAVIVAVPLQVRHLNLAKNV